MGRELTFYVIEYLQLETQAVSFTQLECLRDETLFEWLEKCHPLAISHVLRSYLRVAPYGYCDISLDAYGTPIKFYTAYEIAKTMAKGTCGNWSIPIMAYLQACPRHKMVALYWH